LTEFFAVALPDGDSRAFRGQPKGRRRLSRPLVVRLQCRKKYKARQPADTRRTELADCL